MAERTLTDRALQAFRSSSKAPKKKKKEENGTEGGYAQRTMTALARAAMEKALMDAHNQRMGQRRALERTGGTLQKAVEYVGRATLAPAAKRLDNVRDRMAEERKSTSQFRGQYRTSADVNDWVTGKAKEYAKMDSELTEMERYYKSLAGSGQDVSMELARIKDLRSGVDDLMRDLENEQEYYAQWQTEFQQGVVGHERDTLQKKLNRLNEDKTGQRVGLIRQGRRNDADKLLNSDEAKRIEEKIEALNRRYASIPDENRAMREAAYAAAESAGGAGGKSAAVLAAEISELDQYKQELLGNKKTLTPELRDSYEREQQARVKGDRVAAMKEQQLQKDILEGNRWIQGEVGKTEESIRRTQADKMLRQYQSAVDDPEFESYAARGSAMDSPVAETSSIEYGRVRNGLDTDPLAVANESNIKQIAKNYRSGAKPTTDQTTRTSYMTREERDIYNYWLAKAGPEAAAEYLGLLEEQLSVRAGEYRAEDAEKSGIPRSLYSLIYGLEGAFHGISQFGKLGGQDVSPYHSGAHAQQILRENAGDGERILMDLAYSGGNMLPSIGASVLTGGLVGAPGALANLAGSLTMFGTSGGSAYADAIAEGKTEGEAITYGILNGASEAGLQYLLGGISQLGGKTTQAVRKTINNALARASSNPAVQSKILGILTNAGGEGVEEYLQSILDPVFRNLAFGEENKFELFSEDALYDALIGAVMGGGFSTVETGVDYGRTRAQGREAWSKLDNDGAVEGLSMLQNLPGENYDEIVLKNLARKIVEDPEGTSDFELGQAATALADPKIMEKSARWTAAAEADQRRAARDEAESTRTENPAARSVLVSGIEPRSAQVERTSQAPADDGAGGESVVNRGTPRVLREDAEAGGTIDAAKIQSIAEATGEGGTTGMKVRLKDGREVDLDSVVFANPNQKVIYERAAQFDTRGANAFVAGSAEASAGLDTYTHAFKRYYDSGRVELPFDRIPALSTISKEAAMRAYLAGTNDAAEAAKQAQARVDAGKGNTVLHQGGAIHNYTVELNESQRAQVSALDRLGQITGIQISIDEEVLGGAANGSFDPDTNTVHIALDAVDGAYVRVAGHELTHFIQKWSPEQYRALRTYVLSELDGVHAGTAERMIQKNMELYKRNGVEISREAAADEVVADASEMFLRDGEAIRKLARENRTLAEKVRDFIRDLLADLKKIFKDMNPRSAEAKILSENMESLQEAERLWNDALADAADAHRRTAEDTRSSGAQEEGPRYWLNPKFEKQYDAWDGHDPHTIFNIGTTSEALQSIGIVNARILWDGSKIAKIKEKHPAMTDEIIKQVPSIIEYPVIVMESKQKQSRIVMFGEVFDTKNNPVLAVLELRPTLRGQYDMDIIKIASAYGKDTNPQGLINSSKLLYIDPNKNRTNNWLKRTRLQLPFILHQYGPIDKISYSDTSVNTSVRNTGRNDTRKFSMKDAEEHDAAVLSYFGRTTKWAETGYLLLDGQKLDFSGRHDGAPGGYRTVDHRDISDALGEDYGGDSYSGAMVQFMQEGNIRIIPENNGINLSVMPTEAQMKALSEYISRADGEVNVDIDNSRGDTLVSAEYPSGTRARKVLNDIQEYFTNGKLPYIPEASRYRYSIKEGMAEEERYEELKDAKLSVAQYDADSSKLTRSEVERLERATRRDARRYVKELYGKFGLAGRYANRAADIEFNFGDSGFSKSVHEQNARNADYASFGQMLACFDEVVENAIPLEIHKDKYAGTRRADADLQRVFVLTSGYEDHGFIPVQLEIKEFIEKDNSLYVAVTLNKIRDVVFTTENVSEDTPATAVHTSHEDTVLATESTSKEAPARAGRISIISLSEMFKNINPSDGEFLKYVPDGFLNSEQKAAKKEALAKEQNKLNNLRFSLKDTGDVDYDALARENENLRELNRLLKAEFRLTHGQVPDAKRVKQLSRMLLKKYSSSYDVDTLAANIDQVFRYIHGTDPDAVNMTEVLEATTALAKGILEKSAEVDTKLYDEYRDLRETVRGTAITLDPEYRGDLGGYGGYEAFRRQHFGKIRLSQDGLPVSVFYEELAGRYPELFDGNEFTHPADQLVHIAGVLDEIKPTYRNPYGMNMDEAAGMLASELFDAYFSIPEMQTFADKKQAEKIAALHKLRSQYKTRMEKMREDYRARNQNMLEKFKERRRADQALREERSGVKKYRSRLEGTLRKLSKWLLSPTDRHHVPESFRGAVAEMLAALDTGSIGPNARGEATKRTQAFARLRAACLEMMNEGLDIDPDLATDVDAAMELAGDKKIMDMGASELRALNDVVSRIDYACRNANRMKTMERFETVSELANTYREENRGRFRKERAIGGTLDSFLNYDMLGPVRYFDRMGGEAGKAIWRSIRGGLDKKIERVTETRAFMERLKKELGVKGNTLQDWSQSKPKRFEVEGGAVELTPAQVMSLYLLNKREQGRRHIYLGGIKQERVVTGRGLAKRLHKSYEAVRVSEADVAEITDSLTEKQRAFADGIAEFFRTDVAAWGNEVSMDLYGYKKFREANYYPIRVDSNTVAKGLDQNGELFAVIHLGATKATNPSAQNPLMVEDIFDVFTRHTDQMGTYSAFARPLSDIVKFYNFRYGKDSGGGTMQQELERALGTKGKQYLYGLLKDINGRAEQFVTDSVASRRISRFKAASVGLNLRVIVQQPTSIVRALDTMNPKYFRQWAFGKSRTELMHKYAPISAWKSYGFFELDTGRSMKGVLFDEGGWRERIMAGAQKADDITWQAIWIACEKEVATTTDLRKGSEAFYEAVGERFSDVIDRTQVVDSVLHRAQIMRGKDNFTKMTTSFMAEPIKSYNMMVSKLYDVKNNPSKQTATKLVRSVLVFLANAAAVSAAAALVDAIRDDEDDPYWQRFANAFGENLVSNVNPMNLMPYARDVMSLIEGYSVERMDMEGIGTLVMAFGKWGDYLEKGNESKYTVPYLVKETSGALGKLIGMPIGNVSRWLEGLSRSAQEILAEVGVDTSWWEYETMRTTRNIGSSLNRKTYAELILKAREEGNIELATQIFNDMLKAGHGKDEIENSISRIVRKELAGHPVVMAAVEARHAGDLETYKSKIKSLTDGWYTEKEVAGAVNSVYEKRYEAVAAEDEVEFVGPEYFDEEQGDVFGYDILSETILSGDIEDIREVRDVLLNDYGKEMKTIKSSLTRRFKPVYLEYLAAGETEKAKELKDLLIQEFDYTEKAISKWSE